MELVERGGIVRPCEATISPDLRFLVVRKGPSDEDVLRLELQAIKGITVGDRVYQKPEMLDTALYPLVEQSVTFVHGAAEDQFLCFRVATLEERDDLARGVKVLKMAAVGGSGAGDGVDAGPSGSLNKRSSALV